LGRFWRFDGHLMKQLVAIGTPMALTFLLEYGLFGGAGLVVGLFGASALAAHQIALQIAAILFMIPFGISLAATVRVGQEAGRRNPKGARRAGFVAIGLALVFMTIMTVLVVSLRDVLPYFFLDESMKDAAEIVSIASWLLLLGATFFIADGVQTAMAGSLRGLNDTKLPMLFALISFWVIGFGALYGLAFPLKLGVTGVWIGFTIGLIVYCILLVSRFHVLTARGYLPDVPKAEEAFPRTKPLPAE